MHYYHQPMNAAEELMVLSVKDKRTPDEDERIRGLYAEVGDQVALQLATDNKLVPMMAHG